MEPIPEYDRHLQGKTEAKPPWQRGPLDSLRHFLVVLMLVAGAGAIVWGIFVAIQSATSPPVINTLKTEAVSPDGKWRAMTILHVGPPALLTAVLIQDASHRADPNTKPMIYAQEFELPLRLRWDGPRALTVFIPSDAPNANVLRQAEKFEGIEIKYEAVKMLTDNKATSANE